MVLPPLTIRDAVQDLTRDVMRIDAIPSQSLDTLKVRLSAFPPVQPHLRLLSWKTHLAALSSSAATKPRSGGGGVGASDMLVCVLASLGGMSHNPVLRLEVPNAGVALLHEPQIL